MVRALTIVVFWLFPQFASSQQSSAGVDVSPAAVINVPTTALDGDQKAAILLPSGYEARIRYPVLYLLHGGGQDHTAFATREWFRSQVSRNFIIVTPNAGDSWYVNSASDPKARFEDFIIQDLVPYIDSHYRTMAGRGHSWELWGTQLVNYLDLLSGRWRALR